MYEVDFHAIEKTGETGSKSGDAITVRFTEVGTGRERVLVVDGGFKHSGEGLLEHIEKYYETSHVDLMISTHPDQDHINGLATVLDDVSVGELLIHRPHDHTTMDVNNFSNIAVVDALIALAEEKGVTVTEPFTGLTRFGGQVRILGPTQDYYEALVEQHLDEVASGEAQNRASRAKMSALVASLAGDLLHKAISWLPLETLREGGETGPRNNSSVITLVTCDAGKRLLFTGDAGIEALTAGMDEYEALVAPLPDKMMGFFQAPHHGSKRNLAPSLLDRLFGGPSGDGSERTSFISSAKQDKKHPSPKVTNALLRRGLEPIATEGRTICDRSPDAPDRAGWVTLAPIGPLNEDED